MPQHQLHPYFRFLVDHPEVLKSDKNMESQEEKANASHADGALSLLGSVYGSGDDEDVEAEIDREPQKTYSSGTSSAAELSMSSQAEQAVASANALKDDKESILHQALKMKVPASSKAAFNGIKPSGFKKDGNVLSSSGCVERPTASSLFPLPNVERSIVDPPSEMKRLVDRIVEMVMKNGKNFEKVLTEQDKKVGKFPFLRPSNEFHPYYLKALKKAQESRVSVKSFSSGKDGPQVNREMAHSVTKNEIGSSESGSDDFALDDDIKEKFKMVIGKSKKDLQDQASKEHQPPSGFTVDTAAAAAILQAARRGVRKPDMNIFSRTFHASSYEGSLASDSSNLQSSQQQNLNVKEAGKSTDTNPVAKDIAENALHATAGEASSSETSVIKEQKVKAERLRRAKMFAAMIKSGAAPLGEEPVRALSMEPCGSEKSGSTTQAVNEEVTKMKSLKNLSDNENEQKLRLHRHYRSRKHSDSEGDEEKGEYNEEGDRHSKRRHRAHHSSRHRDRSKDKHKHRSRDSASKKRESRRRRKRERSSSLEDDVDGDDRHKYDNSSSEEAHKRIRQSQRCDSSSENEHKRQKGRHRHDNSLDDEHKQRKQRHRHDIASEDEHRRQKRGHKHFLKEEKCKGGPKNEDTSNAEEAELEEGEILTKSSDRSLSAICNDASREGSVDVSKSPSLAQTTEVPDDLRAKIRAMLLATM